MPDAMQPLRDSVAAVHEFYMKHGCPCRFPRFRRLVSFDFKEHGLSPHALHEQDEFLALAVRGKKAVYVAEGGPPARMGDAWHHKCSRCGAEAMLEFEEYSIIMHCERLVVRPTLDDLGALAVTPSPLHWGPYGVGDESDRKALDSLFRQVHDLSEFESFMTELA